MARNNQGDIKYLCGHFDRDGGGSVDFDEMVQTIDEYKQSKEMPDTPSSDETQKEGEMLITKYEGFDSVVYRIQVDTPTNATAESQNADVTIRLIGDAQTTELSLPRTSPTRTQSLDDCQL